MTDPTLESIAAPSDVAAALEAAVDHAQLLGVDHDVLVVAHRQDRQITPVDLERYLETPLRQRGTVKAFTATGFVSAVDHRSVPGERSGAVVYANPDECRLVAVLDDDHGLAAGWREHRIELALQTTPEWDHWTRHTGLRPQGQFAEIIEAGESDIVGTPNATTMLEIAQTFHASIGAKFKQQGVLKSGVKQLVYEEDIDAKGQTSEGLVDIPDHFTVAVRPFYGAEVRPMECRLRFRIKGGELTIGYVLNRPDEIRRDAFANDVMGQVETQLGDVTLVEGTPAGPVCPGR